MKGRKFRIQYSDECGRGASIPLHYKLYRGTRIRGKDKEEEDFKLRSNRDMSINLRKAKKSLDEWNNPEWNGDRPTDNRPPKESSFGHLLYMEYRKYRTASVFSA